MGSVVRSIGRIIRDVGEVLTSPRFLADTFTSLIISVGLSILAPKPKIRNSSLGQSSYSSQLQNRSLMIKQPIISRDVVYGETKKSGGILFMETSDNNNFVHLVVQIASHEIQSFDKIFFNDEELTLTSSGIGAGTDANGISRLVPSAPSKFVGVGTVGLLQFQTKVRIKQHLGSDDQLADADLVSEVPKWTTAHRLRGIAYLYIRLQYDADMFPNGLPNVSAQIKGKKVLDFRTGSTAFSSNSALCIYDYLSDSKYGLGTSTSNIDTTSFTTMANLCDEDVTLSAGGTENRYECHGIVYNDISPMDILDDMLSSCLGILSYSNGKFIIRGGQYISPALTLTEDDFISGIDVQTKQSRRSLFNSVKGIFTSDETNFQPSDYPAVSDSTAISSDGETLFADLDLPFTKTSTMAQRIAKVFLRKSRQQIVLSGKVSMKAFTLQVGDTVSVTNTRLGFSSKVFEVAQYVFNSSPDNIGIDLILKETASSVYDWNAEEQAFNLDNTTLPTAETVEIPSITVTDKLRAYAETPITVLEIQCASSDGTTNEFEVETQNTNETDSSFVTLGRSKGNVFELVNAEDGAIYNVRARSINAFGVHSDFVTASHQVVGKTAPPSDVTDFSSNVVGDVVHLAWTPISDLDLSHYIIRHSPLTTGQKFEEGLVVAEKIGKPANTVVLPAQTGTYMIKAIDVLGLESENSAKTVIIKNAISRDFNVVTSSTPSPNFTIGTIGTDLELVTRDSTNFLQLIEGTLFDDASGNFDDATGNFDDGSTTTFNADGVYDFPVFDLAGIYNSRVIFTCKFNRFDRASLFDSTVGLFDDQTGNFEGGYSEHNDVNVELLIATSTDGSSYTDFRNYILGDYRASHIKLRAKLTTTKSTATPSIYELSATVDMPDSTRAEDDVASGTSASGKTVTFSPAFKELQGLGISAQSLATGDFYELTSKSATGFTIKFKNSSGTVVDRDFDYVAKGFGYVESA
jgi:hypothetical protein